MVIYTIVKTYKSHIAQSLIFKYFYFLRLQFFQTWIDVGEPLVYWLSGFYFTQSFMTGVLQNYSRKNKLQIDLVTIRFEITEFETDVKDSLDVGVYIKVSALFNLQSKHK